MSALSFTRAPFFAFVLLSACTGTIGARPDAGIDRGADAQAIDGPAGTDAAAADALPRDADLALADADLTGADADIADAGDNADAEVSDAGLPDSGAPEPCPQALICDDFESYALGGAPGGPWQVSTNGGSVTIDTAHAASGTHAVLVHTNGGANFRRAFFGASGAPLFPALETALYGRARMFAVGLPLGSVHWTSVQVEGTATTASVPAPFRANVRYGGQHQTRLMANYDTGDGIHSDCWQHSQTTMPENSWACFEWYFDQASNHMDLWLDGTQLNDLTLQAQGEGCIAHDLGDQWIFPRFETLWLGWEHYQTMGPIDVWIDDVAVGPVRLGCN